ncbi:MAG: DUF6177 family protein, partial [Ruaniaceae bacterium]|nr:DUF6177 family protein [Ruaniaceae bacterium]
IRGLTSRLDGEIAVCGPDIARSVTELGLIDEYRLYLHPVVLGRGKPFFAGPRPPLRLAARDLIGERHSPINVDDFAAPALFFDIYAGDRADEGTVIGPLAEHAVGGLGGGTLERYGRDEPLTHVWDHGALTDLAQRQMPQTDPILAASEHDAWVSLTLGRTRTGIVERAHGGVPLPLLSGHPPEQRRESAMPIITDMMSGLVERFRPLVALVTAGEIVRVNGRYGYRPGSQPVDGPLAVLIGPRAVRDLNLECARLAEHHDVTMLGPGRVPSALVRMTGRDALWAQLSAFAYDLDQERLERALGFEARGWT